MKKKFILAPILIVAILTFWEFPRISFQQDEWHAFGFILSEKFNYVTLHKPWWELIFADRMGARLLMYFLFQLVGLRAPIYGGLALLFHFINTWLVYLLTKTFTKKDNFSLMAAIFFLTNSIAHQAYSWFGTFAGSVTSLTFILLSLINYLRFLDKNRTLNLMYAAIWLFISLLFKETGVFLFIFYPMIYFFYHRSNFLTIIKKHWILMSYGLLILILQARSLIYPSGQTTVLITTNSNLNKIFINLLTYPLTSLGQLFIPSQLLYKISDCLVPLLFPKIKTGTTAFDLISQITIGTSLSVIFSIILLIILWRLFKQKDFNYRKSLFFAASFSFLSFLPYSVINRGEAYLEPRYYYAGTVGYALIIVVCASRLWRQTKSLARLAGITLLAGLLFLQIKILRSDFHYQAQVARKRQKIINKMMNTIPVLPTKIILFVDGDSAYYGLEELKIPFQSGLGQVLLTIYASKGQIDPVFFREESLIKTQDYGFLYDTIAQGYREIAGRGFGYFWDKQELKNAVSEARLDKLSVYGFFYHSTTQDLQNITTQLRESLN